MGTERTRELRRRRQRSRKLVKLSGKVAKASKAEKVIIVEKIRRLTPGAEEVIARIGLKD